MEIKHTPGPWKCESGLVERMDGAVIARMDRSEEATKAGIYPVERDANAKLIASAPLLLDVLKHTLARLEAKGIAKNGTWTDELSEAIAKAEGK